MFRNCMLALAAASVVCLAMTVWFSGRAQYWAHHASDPVCLTLKTGAGAANECEAAQKAAEQRERTALAGAGLCFAAMVLGLAGFWARKHLRLPCPDSEKRR